MASMALKTTALLLTLNLVFFSLVSSQTLPPSPASKCPDDGIKYSACAGMLGNLLNGITVGTPPTEPCCGLFFGLVEMEAATCLCKAIKTNLMGVNLDASLSINLLFNNCGKDVPSGFQC